MRSSTLSSLPSNLAQTSGQDEHHGKKRRSGGHRAADPALVAGLARMSLDPNQPHPKTKSAAAVKPNEGWPPMSEKSLEQCRQIICVVAASSG